MQHHNEGAKAMKNYLLISLVLVLSCGQKGNMTVSENNEKSEKIIYTMGVMFGEQLRGIEPTEGEISLLVQGVRDGVNKNPQVDIKKYSSQIRSIFRERGDKMAKKMEEMGAQYMKKFLTEEQGMETESGIGYKILQEGKGKNPKISDRVKVHYHGTLIDGTVFDSSVDRKKPLTFPLAGVITCWKEGMQKIKVGGKIKLVCPAKVAYGNRGAPPKIPGGATLLFDVELLEITADAPPSSKKKKKSRSKKKKK